MKNHWFYKGSQAARGQLENPYKTNGFSLFWRFVFRIAHEIANATENHLICPVSVYLWINTLCIHPLIHLFVNIH